MNRVMLKDFELLKSLYEIYSPSKGEKRLRKFVKRQCKERGADVVQDNNGNVYVTKGDADTYPCICAHLDQVQDNHSKDFAVYMQNGIIFAYSAKSKAQQGLGADDKNGIWIALQLLEELDVLKCAFFVGEEIGCVGSSAADMSFFKDVRYCIQPDRRNGGDLITNIGGDICSQDFIDAIGYEGYGYKETTGLMTDVEELCSKGIGVSCINISCGYYHPHTDEECTDWSELNNALNFARHICTTLEDVYPHKYKATWYGYGGYGGYWNNKKYNKYGGYGDYDYSDWYKESGSKTVVTTKTKYTQDQEDDDYSTMIDVLGFDDYLTFDDIYQWYGYLFNTQDKEILKRIYNDCLSYHDWKEISTIDDVEEEDAIVVGSATA